MVSTRVLLQYRLIHDMSVIWGWLLGHFRVMNWAPCMVESDSEGIRWVILWCTGIWNSWLPGTS